MATVLCVWELGADLGHLVSLRAPIEVALTAGHEVVLAARQLHRVPEVLGDLPVTYLQAPFKQDAVAADQAAFQSYTHLLARQCFSGVVELHMYLQAWQAIYALVRPDVVLFEHSPTALIAAYGYDFKKILVGNGFTAPPVSVEMGAPFVPFPTTELTPAVVAGLQHDDEQVLKVIQAAQARIAGSLPLCGLRDIYAQADAIFLMTWPELDPFGPRSGERYLGVNALAAQQAPAWPEGGGAKVFGYLQVIPAMERLLKDLHASDICALIYVRNLPESLRAQFSGERMRFIDHLVDLRQVAQTASWVLHHGNHSTMAAFLAAGVPQLVIPRHQEHLFAALRLVSQGCGAMAFQDQTAFTAAIGAMGGNPQLKPCAQTVARQCLAQDTTWAAAYIGKTFASLLPPPVAQ